MYENTRFSRYVMYRSIEMWSKINQVSGIGKTLGGNSPLLSLYPSASWEITDLNTGVDAENLPWKNSSIDIIVSDQMLEHVQHPWKVRNEIIRVLKPNGIVILTTCFLQNHHHDHVYFTFHMDGLRSLFEKYLYDYVCEGWGNREANDLINWNHDIRMSPVEGNEELEKLIAVNDFTVPFTTWIMGKKL